MIKIFRCALLAFFFALSISFTSAAATDGKLWVNTYAGALGLDLSVNPQPHVVAGGYDIAVDQSTGNLWAYDGLSISSYQSDGTSLASYPVNVYGAMSHLAVDSTIGNIWLTIENKLYIFDLTGTMLNQIELSFNNFQLNLDRKNQLLYLSDDYEVHVFNVLGEKLYTLDLLGGLSLRVFTLDPLQDSVLVLAGDKILRFDAAGNLISQADDSKLDYFKNLSADGRGGFWSASYDFVYHYDAIGGYDFEAFGFKNPDSYGDIGTILTMIADPASDTVWLGSYYDLKHINLQGEALYSLNTYLFEGVEHQIFKMKMYYGDGDSTPSTVPLIEITSPQNGSVFRDTAPQINLAFTPQQSAIDTTSLVLELNQIPVQLDCTVSQSSAQCLFVSFPGVGSHVLRARISNDLGEISQPALLQFEIGTNSAPVINSAPVLNVTAGDLYVYDVNATDTDGDSITYSLSAQAPSTMQIDGVSGLISWQTISTDIGVVAIDVVATDSFGASVTQRFSLTVEEAFILVPDVVGAVQTVAEQTIVDNALVIGVVSSEFSSTVPQGTVISQLPVSGSSVNPGAAVNLVISAGPELTLVPDLVNTQVTLAEGVLTGASLTLGTQTNAFSATVAAGRIISQLPVGGVQVEIGTAVDVVVSAGFAPVLSPNVVGMAQATAQSTIVSAGLAVGTISTGTSDSVAAGNVISQSPLAGISVAAGSAVNLVVSTGPAPVNVPGVVGMAQAAAQSAITSAGLTVGTISTANSDTVAVGDVISQSPTAGTSVAAGSAVNLVVSSGPAPVNVPGVVGMAQAAAQSAITSVGLTVGTISTANSDTVAVGDVISQSPAAGTSVAAGSAVNLVVSSGPAPVNVPGVVGMAQATAQSAITSAGLTVGTISTASSDTVAVGGVISQSPAAGTSVAAGSAVNLVVSSGPAPVNVPGVVGMAQAAAQSAITSAGLTVGTISTANSDTVAVGDVISQSPAAGTSVAAGSAVNLVVSSGPAPVNVPGVVGMAQAAAQSAITSAGLTVGTISTANSDTVAVGDVISQSPAAGTSVAAGSAVNLVVSSGPAPVNVPGVVGMAQAAAQSAITSADLTVGTISTANSDTVAVGDVISQSPTAGTSVAAGSAINLVVSSGPVPISVPNVVGTAQADAESSIISAGLTVGVITIANNEIVAAGDVISQSPVSGALVAPGSAVNIVVSSGPTPVNVPGVVGMAQATAQSAITSAGLTVGTISTANSDTVAVGDVISQSPAAGTSVAPASTVNLVVSSGPAPINVPGVVGLAQATAQGAITSAGLTVGTISTANSDTVAVGDVISQSPAAGTSVAAGSAVNLVVSSGPATAVALPLDVTVTASPQIINQGETAVVTVVSNGGIVPVNVALTVDGVSVSLDGAGQYSLTATQAGTVELIANASDTTETVESRGFISVREPTDTVAPVVDISTPGADAEITSAANIIGTASDDNLAEYRLEISPVGKNQFTEIAFGYTQVVNGVLGVFDPGLYTNGLYDIRLIATDVNGLQSVTMTTYQTSGDVKVGNFSFTVTDLTIPVAGIPITVNRTYDTRRKSENLDFGYGWSIDYQDIKIEENKELGANWRQTQSGGFLPTYCIEPNVPNTVSVRLPDGRVERFSMSVSPQCQQLVPPTDVSPVFTATSGTTSQLADTSGSVVRLNGGRLLDMSTIETYNPSRYRLTTLDGLVYQLDQNFGVRSVTDRNGNVLTFSNAGITHSSGKGITFNRDSAGRIISITDPNGGVIEYAYNVNGDLESVLNQTGELTQHRYNRSHGLTEYINVASVSPTRNIYDDTGRLVAQIDPEGNRVDFIHDLSGQFTTVNNQRGFPTQYQYDSSGNILAQVDALSNTTQYTYDSNDNQLSKTDALGNATVFTYNALGQQLSKTDALGNVYSSTYNSFGKELGLTDENGSVITNAYDTNGNLLSITDPLGNSVSNVIGSNGLPSRVTNALGDSTQYVYDSSGQVVTQTDAAGNITNFTYDSNGNNLSKSVTRTVNGVATTETTVLTYDSLNRLVSKTDALGGVTRIEYDAAGNKVRDIDPLGRITEYTYDIYRRVIATTYPDNSASVKAYDVEGNLVSETDRDGNTVTYVYDALNRQTSVVYADGTSFQTEYDALGKVIAEIDSNANRTEYEYDALGRRTLVRDALGNITRFTYDNVGNVVTVTDALNNITRYEYDAVGQKIRTIYPDLSEILQTYDAAGQMTSKTDQNGNTIRYVYDSMNRLIEVTDALTGRTQYGYDEVGNKVSQTDALGRVTTWTFDALGRELSRTLPMGQIELKSYDAAGNMLSHTDFNGQLATYTYDSNNQVSQITYSDGAFETFRYALEGLRTEAVDRQGGVHTWVYDARNRLLQDVKPDGDVIAYQYDNMGNKTALVVTLSAGTSETTTYEYDQLNRLQRVTAGLDVTAYTYNAVGSRESVLYGNGNLTTYSYNTLNRLTGVSTVDSLSAVLTNYQYTLDAAGNRIQLVDQNSRTTTYAYDAMNRLISETSIDAVNGNHTASYVLDVVGNRLSETVNSVTTLSVFDNNDRLTQQGTTLYSYDAAGNAISKTNGGVSTSYTYDVKNELIEQNVAGVISTYAYDVNGIRRAAVNDGNASRYLIDSNRDYAQVIREVSATGTVAYNYGIDLINQSRSGTQSYYLYDGLGTVTGLSDVTGNLSDSYIYDAFGNMLSQTGTTENSYLFAGEQFDSAMNQYYLRARYYDQSAGRFTQQDTWMGINEDPRTLHKYMYANANPVNNIDPTGNFSLVSISISFSIRSVLSTSTRFVTSFAGRTATRDPSATFLSGGVILMGVLAMKPGFDLRNQALEEFVSAPTDELMNKALAKYRFAGQYIAAMAGAIGQMNTLATSALAITQFARALSRIPTSRVNSIAVSRYTQQSITVETNFRDIIVRMSSSTSISVSIIKTITRDITLAIKEAESAFFAIF